MKRYGVGIIGAGVISGEHVAGFGTLGDRARVIAAADPDPHRLRKLARGRFLPFTFTDHRRMLDRRDIDIVTIATPPSTHEQLVVDALRAGKAVICEKPLAHNLAAVDRIIAAAAAHPGKLCVLHQFRCDPEIERLRFLLDRGLLGKVHTARFYRFTNFARQVASAGWWGRWGVAGGGIAMTQCIHEMDLMLWLLGEPRVVTATARTARQRIESEDEFDATVEFAGGAVLTCGGTLNADKFELEFSINGERATARRPLRIESTDAAAKAAIEAALEREYPSAQPVRPSLPVKVINKVRRKLRLGGGSRPAPASANLHGRLFAAYLDAMDRGGPAPVAPSDARRAIELCTAIYTSAITGEPVALPLRDDTRFYEGITADDFRSRTTPVGV